MAIAERPHSLGNVESYAASNTLKIHKSIQQESSFYAAHVDEVLTDIHTALVANNYDVNTFVQTIPFSVAMSMVRPLQDNVTFREAPKDTSPVIRGTVIYNEGGKLKGIGFDTFADGSIRSIAGRTDETGTFAWMLLEDLPSKEKVRQTGTWTDPGTKIQVPVFERAGGIMVKMLSNTAQEGRVAQSHLRNQVNPALPHGIDLPDYAHEHLSTQ